MMNNASVNFNQSFNQSISVSKSNKQDLDIPFYTIIISVVIYSLIFVIGFFGNALVILVSILNRSHQHSTHKCLVNLSIADLLLIIVCMPSAIVDLFSKEVWYFGHLLCKIIPWLEHTVAHASILTIVAISLERSLAIAKPLKAKLAFTNRRIWLVVIIIWLISSISSIPIMTATIYRQGFHRKLGRNVNICVTVTKERWQLGYLFSTLFLFYLLPCLLLFILYGKVVLVIKNRNQKMKQGLLANMKTTTPAKMNSKGNLRKSHTCKLTNKEVEALKSIQSNNRNDSSYMESQLRKQSNDSKISKPFNKNQRRLSAAPTPQINQKHIILLLIVMMFLILICLLPYRCFSIWVVMASREQLTNLGVVKFYNLITFCRVTFYINSALNPIFYHIISTKFQASFKKFFKLSERYTKSISSNTQSNVNKRNTITSVNNINVGYRNYSSKNNNNHANRFLSLRLNSDAMPAVTVFK